MNVDFDVSATSRITPVLISCRHMGKRCLLIQVISRHSRTEEALEEMLELEQLVATFGGQIIEKSIQHRNSPHPSTYIGPGKLDWLLEEVKKKKINIVILNSVAKSGQLFRLEKELWKVNTSIAVWDRVDLILNRTCQNSALRSQNLWFGWYCAFKTRWGHWYKGNGRNKP